MSVLDSHNKIGMIPYWNLQPLRDELKRVCPESMMQDGHPTQVNQWLKTGGVQMAPSSSICLINDPQLEMAIPIGISADGPVKSVYIGFHVEHRELISKLEYHIQTIKTITRAMVNNPEQDARAKAQHLWHELDRLTHLPLETAPGLHLTKNSASSLTLTKLLYCIFFGKKNYQVMQTRKFTSLAYQGKPIELVIGDEALKRKSSFFYTLDLGDVWGQLTGLPFVYAVWQSKGPVPTNMKNMVLNAAEKAEKKMKVEPTCYLPSILPLDHNNRAVHLVQYWKAINYRLGAREFQGLSLFLCLARHLFSLPLDDAFVVKLIRWQQLSQHQMSI